MRRTPITQFLAFFTLLCVSQALPLLNRPSAAKSSFETAATRNHHVAELNRPDDDGRQHHRGVGQHGNHGLVAFYQRTIAEILSKQQPSIDELTNYVEPIDQSSPIPNIWDSSTTNQAPLAVQAADSLVPNAQAEITASQLSSTSSQSASFGQRDPNPNLRLTTPTKAAENELLQTDSRGLQLFRQRDGSLGLALPLRALEAPPPRTATKRPSLTPLNDLYTPSLSNSLPHLPNEQYGRSRDPVAHQSSPSWFSLPFRRHHGSRIAQYQRSSSKPNPLRHALTGWFSLCSEGRKSSGAIPVLSAVGESISEREPIFGARWWRIFGESVQRSQSLGKPETIFGAERAERSKQLLFAGHQHEHSVADRARLLETPYLGISWDREERVLKEAKALLAKASNHLMNFIPTTVDGVVLPAKAR